MKTRWAVRFVLFLGGLVVATALVLRTEFAGRILCTQGSRIASRLLDLRIAADRCAVEPTAARVVVEGLRVAAPGADAGADPLFSARRIAVQAAPWIGFGGALTVGELEVEDPRVTLDLSTPAPDDGEAPRDGCLAPLRRLWIGRARVTGGSALLRLPGGRTATVAGLDLGVRRRGGGYAIEATLSGALSGGPELPVERVAARARLDPDAEGLALESLQVTLPQGTLEVGGEIRHLCRPELALVATARAGVEPLLALAGADAPEARGLLEATITADGPAAAPRLRGQLAARQAMIDGYEIGELFVTAALEGDSIAVEELLWPIEGGTARVKGRVGLGGDFPVSAEVRTEKLEFQRLMSRLTIHDTPVLMRVDSSHRLAGKLGGGFELAGESAIEVHGFRVRNEPWHVGGGVTVVEVPGVGRIDSPIRITAAGVELPSARIAFGPGSSIDATVRLAFTEEEGLRIRAHSGHLELAHLAGHIAGLPVAGAGALDATIAGPYSDPLIAGTLRLEGARLYSAELGTASAKVTSRPGDGTLDFAEIDGRFRDTAYGGTVRLVLGGEGTMDADVAVREGGKLGDVFLATRGLVEPLAWLHDHVTGRIASLRGRVHGPFARLAAEGEAVATAGTFLERPYDRLEATLALADGQRLELPQVALARGGGLARGTGAIRFPTRGPTTVDAVIDARGLPIRELLGEFAEAIDLTGGAGGRLELQGPLEALQLSGELHADRLVASGVELPAARLSLETQGGEVIVRGPVIGAGRLGGSVRLVSGLPFDAGFTLEVDDLARYLPESAGLGGRLHGLLEARGTLEDLARSRGTVTLERLAVAMGDYRVENDGAVAAAFAGPSFVLNEVKLRGENTELAFAGNRSAEGRLDLEAQGTLDARLLDTLVPEIEHATGVVELRATLTGTAERPSLVGSAQVRRGAFRVRALPLAVQKLGAEITFSQNRLIVEDATMVANGGAARVRGSVGIRSWAPSSLDLSADVDRASWRLPEDFPAVVSGRLRFTGAWPDHLLLSGELNVDRLRYARDLDLEAAVLDFRRQAQQAPAADDVERLRFDLDLVGGPDMRIENNLLRARLQFVAPPGAAEGRLKVVGSNVRVGLLGSVEVVEGEAFFRGNEFRLRQGVIGFAHRDRIDPEVDFTAETDVREYRVVVHGYGRLIAEEGSDLELQLASDPPLPQADVLTLLTFGITSRDPNAGANAAAGAGVAAEALWKVSGLDAQVRRWLPDSEVFRDPTVNVTSQYSEITGQLEPTASFETKFLDERLKLKASTPFATPKGRRASAEYRVDEHLSGQILWENEETGYDAGDLGVDLKLRWEWE